MNNFAKFSTCPRARVKIVRSEIRAEGATPAAARTVQKLLHRLNALCRKCGESRKEKHYILLDRRLTSIIVFPINHFPFACCIHFFVGSTRSLKLRPRMGIPKLVFHDVESLKK